MINYQSVLSGLGVFLVAIAVIGAVLHYKLESDKAERELANTCVNRGGSWVSAPNNDHQCVL